MRHFGSFGPEAIAYHCLKVSPPLNVLLGDSVQFLWEYGGLRQIETVYRISGHISDIHCRGQSVKSFSSHYG